MRYPLKIVLMALVLGLFLLPLSDAVANDQVTYTLEKIEPQTIPLWGQRTWAKTEVTVVINAGNGVTPEAIAKVEQSVVDWNRAIHARVASTLFHLKLITEGKADITIRPKVGGGVVQGTANCRDNRLGFFTSCNLNVSGQAFGSTNPPTTVLSISLQELGHALGFVHSDNSSDVMYGTLQDTPNTKISNCDIDAWEEVMHWLVVDGLDPADAHRPDPDVDSVSCGVTTPDPDPTGVDAHVRTTEPFVLEMGKKSMLLLRMTVQDTSGAPVADASVDLILTGPDGTAGGRGTTDAAGVVTFRLVGKTSDGPYESQITNISGNNITFEQCTTTNGTMDESDVKFNMNGGSITDKRVVDECA